MVLEFILLLTIIFLFIVLSMVWPPDSPWSPWWRTNKKRAMAALKLAKIKSTDTVYELGSGEGTLIISAAKKFKAKGVGVEIDPLRVLLSKIFIRLNKVSDKVKIVKKNFFEVDISDATIVFVYLVPNALKKLKPKFLKELKPGTKILSYRYEINLPIAEYDQKNDIRLYII